MSRLVRDGQQRLELIALREPHSLGRKGIQVRRANLAAVTPQVREPEVIGQHQQDVGPGSGSVIVGGLRIVGGLQGGNRQ